MASEAYGCGAPQTPGASIQGQQDMNVALSNQRTETNSPVAMLMTPGSTQNHC